ncbi:hypothetical protein ABVC50_13615 [Lactobacillus crispatus]
MKLNNDAIKDLPTDLRISTLFVVVTITQLGQPEGGYGLVADYVFAKEMLAPFILNLTMIDLAVLTQLHKFLTTNLLS